MHQGHLQGMELAFFITMIAGGQEMEAIFRLRGMARDCKKQLGYKIDSGRFIASRDRCHRSD
jgi:hypothetical protein